MNEISLKAQVLAFERSEPKLYLHQLITSRSWMSHSSSLSFNRYLTCRKGIRMIDTCPTLLDYHHLLLFETHQCIWQHYIPLISVLHLRPFLLSLSLKISSIYSLYVGTSSGFDQMPSTIFLFFFLWSYCINFHGFKCDTLITLSKCYLYISSLFSVPSPYD